MKTLSKEDYKLMSSLAKLTQPALQNVLYKYLNKIYPKAIYDDAYLYAEGDIPIALVAHMDTVGKAPPKEVFYDREQNVMWSPQLLGADDRAGVFCILKILESGLRPHVIFTTDEEIGCKGAIQLSLNPCPFEKLQYIIQLDRRGSNDCVFYECDNEEFEKYVESFGFITAYGTFTDITELCPSWGMAGVNLSVGYRDEHTVSEVLFVSQMLATIEKVKKMLSVEDVPYFKYIPAFNYYKYLDNYDWGYYGSSVDLGPTEEDTKLRYKCHGCGEFFDSHDVLDVKLIKGGKGYFCADCLGKKADWCYSCGEPFELSESDKGKAPLCPSCKNSMKKGKGKK